MESIQNIKMRLESLGVEELVRQLDVEDPLAKYRNQFHIPKASVISTKVGATSGSLSGNATEEGDEAIYLCGNSLGLQPKSAQQYINNELKRWSEEAVEAHHCGPEPWITWDEVCAKQMGGLVGAANDEVVIMNSLTVNIHLMLAAFYKPTQKRHKILTHASAFPSDTMALRSHVTLRGYDPEEALVVVGPRPGQELLNEEDLVEVLKSIGDEIAVLWIEGVHYLSGQLLDIPLLSREAKAHGVIFGVDLAHAVGNVQLDLHDWGVDFGVWCTYKYLNSGPGGIGACFIHQRHFVGQGGEEGEKRCSGSLNGWWGSRQADRFRMDPNLPLEYGALGFQISNPPVICLATLRASLELYIQVGMKAFITKSSILTGLLELLLKKELGTNVEVVTGAQRGCQLSLKFPIDTLPAQMVLEELKGHGVICDFREPDRLRVAPNPLYNTFQDVHRFVIILSNILNNNNNNNK